MIVIVCLDDKKGMLFNGRRQSRDSAVMDRIRSLCEGTRLWMNSYSAGLYGGLEGIDITEEDDFLSLAGSGEVCLVETERLASFGERIEKIIVFWWNRTYPADFYMDVDLSLWDRTGRREFQGTSHEKITEDVYERR